jgi:prophage antirepressor-like protein
MTNINDGSNTAVSTFNFNNFEVRTITKDGEPYFVATDVCKILNLSNTTEAIKPIADEDKSTFRISAGGLPVNIINESGLYTLILKSNKPEAKSFKKWITSEVLPSIRKTGSYSTKSNNLSHSELILEMAKANVEYERRMKELEQEQEEMKQEIKDEHLDFLKLRNNVNRLAVNNKYLTVIAFANTKNIRAKDYNAAVIGKIATKQCLDKNIKTGSVVDGRFGIVKTYPIEILTDIFCNKGLLSSNDNVTKF